MPEKVIALVELLHQDGVHIPEGGHSADKQVMCFNPNHAATTPTMTVNIVTGTYRCGCSIEGTALTYLTHFKKLEEETACEKLKALGWNDDRIEHARHVERQKVQRRQGLPKMFEAIPCLLYTSDAADE